MRLSCEVRPGISLPPIRPPSIYPPSHFIRCPLVEFSQEDFHERPGFNPLKPLVKNKQIERRSV